jgi:hypothetical protein
MTAKSRIVGRARSLRIGAVAIALVGVAGVAAAGGQAALAKYEALPKVPDCAVAEFPGARPMQQAFDERPHR